MKTIQKRKIFRSLISSSKPLILIGVHDALSAILAERAGWKTLWASSFGFSTASGIPDANLLTYTENLEIIRKINNRTKLPVIADCDNGYGDLAILKRVVEEYEEAGMTGICIEDNIFPKRCSFYDKGMKRELIPTKEHVAKIKLAKSVTEDKNFFIIARTEAFIAGLGIKEALKRAKAYSEAGADAVCIHSKKHDTSEILEFSRHWKYRAPLVAIPTTYFTVSPSTLYNAGYKIVIYANQLIRNAIASMNKFLSEIKNEEKRVTLFSTDIAKLDEVFEITGVNKLKELERKFFS